MHLGPEAERDLCPVLFSLPVGLKNVVVFNNKNMGTGLLFLAYIVCLLIRTAQDVKISLRIMRAIIVMREKQNVTKLIHLNS